MNFSDVDVAPPGRDINPNPWAPGGEMSTGVARDDELGDRSTSAMAAQNGAFHRLGHHRRWVLAAVALVGVIVVGLVVVQRDRNDASPTSAVTATTVVLEATGGATTAAPATEVAKDDELPERETNVAPVTSDADRRPLATGAASLGDVIAASAAPQLSLVDLAPSVAGLEPTEVVMFDLQRSIVEVSIPSGRVRTTDMGFATDRARLVTTDYGALVWPLPGGAYELLSTDGDRAFVNADPVAAAAATPGLDRFYVWHERDGVVDATPEWDTAIGSRFGKQPALADLPSAEQILVGPLGGLLDGGPGGRTSTDETGTTQLTGDVVATGRNHVLLRECDDGQSCRLVTLDTNGFRTLFATDLPDRASAQRIGGLSPSGDAVLMVADRSASVDNPPELFVYELIDGTRRVLRASPDWVASGAWSNDSTGVFVTDVLLYFVDRSTGDTVLVSQELPKLRAPTTRVPRQTPECEVIGIVAPTFEAMRAAGAGDTPVPPPPIELLTEVVAGLPFDVARSARSTLAFVESFVSLEQPESQRPENWPTNARNGLAKLEAFAASC